MTQPKLREGATKMLAKRAVEYAADSVTSYNNAEVTELDVEQAFMDASFWTLNNLHKLLEPRDQPLVNGKRVAIVEVGE